MFNLYEIFEKKRVAVKNVINLAICFYFHNDF
jgi:hypothetical protein